MTLRALVFLVGVLFMILALIPEPETRTGYWFRRNEAGEVTDILRGPPPSNPPLAVTWVDNFGGVTELDRFSFDFPKR